MTGMKPISRKALVVFAGASLVAVALGCAPLRPYRVGGPPLEEKRLFFPQRGAARARLPDARPLRLAFSAGGWPTRWD